MKQKNSILIFLALLLPCAALAQGGSYYSIIGLGDIYSSMDAATSGLAGTAIAMPSDHVINTVNPAMWSNVKTTRLQAGYLFNQHINKTDDGELWQNNGKVNGVVGLLSIDTSMGLTVGFGITPLTMINYSTITGFTIVNENQTIQGINRYVGEGGITRGFLGLSFEVLHNFSIGSYVFGNFSTIKDSVATQFYDYTASTISSSSNDEIRSFGVRSGISYSPIQDFTIGAFYEYNSDLNVYHNIIYRSQGVSDTTIRDTLKFKYPSTFGIGVSWKTGKLLIGSDFQYQDFTGFKYRPGSKATFRDMYSLSVGFSRLGSTSINAPFFDRSKYNLGLGFRQLYYSFPGNDMKEYYGSVGMEMPIVGSAYIDWSFMLGVRGNKSATYMQEIFGRLNVNISIGENWFKPFKREY